MSGASDERPARDYAECEDLARRGDYDRWLATLFSPAEKRPHLHALLAFSLEIARVREVVSEPRLGAIRMQWWREALEGSREEARSHPIAAALLDTQSRFRLPSEAFLNLIDAREFDLWNDPAPTLAWLEGYCGETSSSLFRLASLILADGEDPGGAEAAGHAGLAWAITGLLRALPWHAAQGRRYAPTDLLVQRGADPQDVIARRSSPELCAALADLRAQARKHLELARSGLADMAPVARPAFVVLALVPLYLRRMEARAYDPFKTKVDARAWRKILAMRSYPGS